MYIYVYTYTHNILYIYMYSYIHIHISGYESELGTPKIGWLICGPFGNLNF